MTNDPVERALHLYGRHQGGSYVTRPQLLGCGLGSSSLVRRTHNGTLIVVFPGVYAVGHEPRRPEDRAWAPLLACGEGSALFDLSAAAAYGIVRLWPIPYRVITTKDRRHAGIDIHRAAWLRPSDICIVNGLRVTSPPLTALHIAPTLPEHRLRRGINVLRLNHGLEPEHLKAALRRFPRHPGVRPLDEILRTSEKNPTRSRKEDLWRPFAIAYGFPPYVMNEPFRLSRGKLYIADVYMAEPGVIIEIDGGLHDLQTRADHARDIAMLAEYNLPTLRIDPDEMEQRPAEQAAVLHAAISAIAAIAAGRRRPPG